MKDLSPRARGYIWAILGLGTLVIVHSLPFMPRGEVDLIALGILTLAAATGQFFPVVTSKNQAYELTPIFVFAAVLMLPPGGVALLVVLAYIPEWIRNRKRWYIQLFNISICLVQADVAQAAYHGVAAALSAALGSLSLPAAMVFAALLFTAVNHLLLATVLRLARGQSWRQTHLFELEYFATDATLAFMGVIFALLWQSGSPWMVVFTSAPMFLIYRGLNTPNLQEQARTDVKTGLYNARHFYRVLQEELRRASRFDRSLAVIMVDLDLLRNINNSYGHLAGDVVLKGVADIIKRGLREYDVAARFGGEEFTLLLPECDSVEALEVAERLRQHVESTEFVVDTSPTPIRATISLGVASYPDHGRDANEVIHQADLAVYYAKLQGRNRAWSSSPESRALGPVMAVRRDFDIVASKPAWNPLDGGSEAGAAPVAPCQNGHAGLRAQEAQPAPPLAGGEKAELPTDGGNPGEEMPGKRDNARSRSSDLSWPLGVFISAVVVASVALWAIYSPWSVKLDWWGLAVLAALTAGAQSLAIEIYGRGRISTSAIIILAGGFLFGMPGALLLAPIVPATVWARSRGMLHRALFDAGDTTLSAAAAVLVYQQTVALLPASEPILLLGPAVLAAVAYYAVNVGFISVAIGLSEGRSPSDVWYEKFRWLILHYLVFGLLSVLILLAYRAIGFYGLLSFFVPPVMLRYVMKQYTDRTVETVSELKRVNCELVRAHDDVVSTLDKLRATYDSTLEALSTALDSRDSDTEGHSQRVVECVAAIGRQLGLPESELPHLLNGALLHDVGKIGVPDAILSKKGPLSEEEWAVMRTHPDQGYRMLRHIGFLSKALPVIRHHHERFDGRGYPDGLRGEEIPLGARIFALADAFDAMTSDRPYRRGRSVEDAKQEIATGAGTQFDERVVAAFMRLDNAELERLSGQRAANRKTEKDDGQRICRTGPRPVRQNEEEMTLALLKHDTCQQVSEGEG